MIHGKPAHHGAVTSNHPRSSRHSSGRTTAPAKKKLEMVNDRACDAKREREREGGEDLEHHRNAKKK